MKLDKIIEILLLCSHQDTRADGNEKKALFWKNSSLFHPGVSRYVSETCPWLLRYIWGSNPPVCPLLRVDSLSRRLGFVDLKMSLQTPVGLGSDEAGITSSPHCFQLQLLGVPQT